MISWTGIDDFVDETLRIDDSNVPPFSIEDYGVPLSSKPYHMLSDKQNGKCLRGSDENYENLSGSG